MMLQQSKNVANNTGFFPVLNFHKDSPAFDGKIRKVKIYGQRHRNTFVRKTTQRNGRLMALALARKTTVFPSNDEWITFMDFNL